MTLLGALAIAILGVLLLAAGARSLLRRARDRRVGSLVAADVGDEARTFRSERFRLVGRPDAVRQARDGTLVPVEIKRRAAPARGPYYSHTVQVWAYCLLIEEATGRSPPFGLLRYADLDVRIPWNERARSSLLEIRSEALAPYDGRANPGRARCATCPWEPRCDVSAAR